MSRTNLAYQVNQQQRSPRAQAIPLERPKLRAIEGQGRGPEAAAKAKPVAIPTPQLRALAAISVVVFLVFTTASVAKVSIANATVQLLQTADDISLAIDQARTTGLELEVRHSLENNPTKIQDAAAVRGILPADHSTTIAARSGFAQSTINLMRVAAEEAQALELQQLLDQAAANAASNPDQSASLPEPDSALAQIPAPEPTTALEPAPALRLLDQSATTWGLLAGSTPTTAER